MHKIIEFTTLFLITEDLRAWPTKDYKKTYWIFTRPDGVWLEELPQERSAA